MKHWRQRMREHYSLSGEYADPYVGDPSAGLFRLREGIAGASIILQFY